MARAKKIKYSDEALNDIAWMAKYEPFFTLVESFRLRVTMMAGYKYLRSEMSKATDEKWERVFNDMYREQVK